MALEALPKLGKHETLAVGEAVGPYVTVALLTSHHGVITM